MSSFWRFTLLALFAAAGIGLAICLGLSSNSAAESTSADVAANFSAGPADASAAQPPVANAAQPLLEHANPPIAKLSPTDTQLLAQAASPPSSLSAPPAPSGQNDLPKGANSLPILPAPSPAINNSSSLPTAVVSSASAPPAPQSQTEVMQQLQLQLQRALEERQNLAAAQTASNAGRVDNASGLGNVTAPNNSPARGSAIESGKTDVPTKSKPRITKMPGEGDNNLSIHLQDADLRDVLELLSEQGGLNILPSTSVQGKVSAALNGVDIDTAMAAILRSTGYVARHDGPFIYVGTPQDFKAMAQAADTIGTRVYHVNYVRSTDIQSLVTPLLTPGIGSISVTAPAEEGIGSDGNKAGGNSFAGGEAVLVHDFTNVLNQVDQVIAEVDHKPAQVAIEAMILKVTLDDVYNFGVDFAFLQNNPHVHLFTGSPLGDLSQLAPNGGLQFGFLDGSTAAFVSALESIGDTNIIASPRLMVVDKARAEILIGNQDGYVNSTVTETSTAQNVQFLETGAALRLRPFISSDGMVRMEVHPELSTGSVQVTGGQTPLTLPHKDVTQVTTNIMVPDGCTVVIGGLMRDELDTTTSQVPLLGSLPGVGFLFRHKQEETAKKEIIVLITPHIVCEPDACCEGDKVAAEFHRRQAVYADQMSPLGKRYLGRKYYRLAQTAWAKSDQATALRFIDLSIQFDPLSKAAIDLRTDIWNGNLSGEHCLLHPGPMPPGDELSISDMVPNAAPGMSGSAPQHLPAGSSTVPQPRYDGLPAPGLPGKYNGNMENLLPGRPAPMDTTGMKLPPDAAGTSLAAGQTPAPFPVPSVPTLPRIDSSPPASNAGTTVATDSRTNGAARIPTLSSRLDGDQLPKWVVDGLIQPATASEPIGASATPQNAQPINGTQP